MKHVHAYFEMKRIAEDIEAGGPQKRAFIKTFQQFLIFSIVIMLVSLIADILNGMSFGQAMMDTFIYPLFD